MLIRVLLALSPARRRHRLRRLIRDPSAVVAEVTRRGALWERLTGDNSDLLIADLETLPEPFTANIAAIRELPDQPEVIIVRAEEDSQERAELIAAGCMAIVNDHLSDDALAEALATLVERRRSQRLDRLGAHSEWSTRFDLGDFVTHSAAMRQMMTIVHRISGTNSSLLLLGETGVGKEWLARAIHAASPRSGGPFLAVNCAALPESLLESELFGHEQGAFTGAVRARRGYFELAHRGTLFLDEIGDMPLHLQAKLLRVLQDHVIHRVGSEDSLRIDVRVMAATNRDLWADVEARRFRADLYYRLGVVSVTVPPLRERRDDIPALAFTHLAECSLRFGRRIATIDDEALQALIDYAWPGNVRELINVIERAVLLCTGSAITMTDLPDTLQPRESTTSGTVEAAAPRALSATVPFLADLSGALDKPLPDASREVVAAFERVYLTAVLERCGGRIGEAARAAGIDPRSLYNKLKRLGIDKADFKPDA